MLSAAPALTPAFRRYWLAAAVSDTGTYVSLIALQSLVVLTLDGSAADVGLLNAARWLPYLVFGVVVGALVDRRRRLPLMVATDLFEGLVLLAIPALWMLDALTLPALLLVVVVYATAGVVNGAAATSFLPRIVEPASLQRAHARIDGTDAVASTGGPALGGLLVSAVGAPVGVAVDAVSYLFSAAALSRIKVDEAPPTIDRSPKTLPREMAEGIRWIYRGSGLKALAISTHVWFAGNAIVGVVLAPLVLVTLDLGALRFGICAAIGGVGALAGALVTTRVGRVLGTGRTIIACHTVTALAVLVLASSVVPSGVAAPTALVAVGQFLYGIAIGASNSHEISYQQLITPSELHARTNTTLRSINRAVMVVVAPLAGLLADAWGIAPMLLVAAGVFGLVVIGLWATPFRKVRAPEPTPEEDS